MRLPAIGARTDGIPEVIQDGKTGMLFEAGDSADLARKLETLILDRVLRQEMGQSGRAHALENFTRDIMVQKIAGVVRSLLEEP